MDFSDEVIIDVPRQRVWDLLNDSQSLAGCIPGLSEVEVYDGGSAFGGTAQLELGSRALRFPARVAWVERNVPDGGKLRASATLAGFQIEGDGTVSVREHDPGATRLSWMATVTIPESLADNPLLLQMARAFAARFVKGFFECVQSRLKSV